MISEALLLVLRDLAIGSLIASVGFALAALWIAHQHTRYIKQRRALQRKAMIAKELTVAEKRREGEIQVRGPLPHTRDWDRDHSTRTSVGRRLA